MKVDCNQSKRLFYNAGDIVTIVIVNVKVGSHLHNRVSKCFAAQHTFVDDDRI